jgi:uncharacterized coiled-coil protein SlyX
MKFEIEEKIISLERRLKEAEDVMSVMNNTIETLRTELEIPQKMGAQRLHKAYLEKYSER